MANAPDWNRYVLPVNPTGVPVGDSTRWGAEYFQPLADNLAMVTPQILQVQTADPYARSWALLGTLSMPAITWNRADLFVQLDISMGVGQITIQQAIMLMHPAITSPPVGLPTVGRGGLCLEQNFYFGGPYNSQAETNAGGDVEARGFAIIGGLIGHSISVRARYESGQLPPTPGFPAISRLAMIVTPFAAGQGL